MNVRIPCRLAALITELKLVSTRRWYQLDVGFDVFLKLEVLSSWVRPVLKMGSFSIVPDFPISSQTKNKSLELC
jgi:hypothetical protein